MSLSKKIPYIIDIGDAEQELLGRYEKSLNTWSMMTLTSHPYTKTYKLDGFNDGEMAHPVIQILPREIKSILT